MNDELKAEMEANLPSNNSETEKVSSDTQEEEEQYLDSKYKLQLFLAKPKYEEEEDIDLDEQSEIIESFFNDNPTNIVQNSVPAEIKEVDSESSVESGEIIDNILNDVGIIYSKTEDHEIKKSNKRQ